MLPIPLLRFTFNLGAWRSKSFPTLRILNAGARTYSAKVDQTLTQTNIKDVILFKYDNPKFYKYLNIFAVVQFTLMACIGKLTVSSMKDVPVTEEITADMPWWRKVNLGEGKYKNTLAVICYTLGFATLCCSWLFTLRSVRFLILNKGGQKVSIVTYTPVGSNRILAVPLDKVSCNQSRTSTKTSLPLKVQNHTLNYLLDMRGEFKNGPLFDVTAGMRRTLK